MGRNAAPGGRGNSGRFRKAVLAVLALCVGTAMMVPATALANTYSVRMCAGSHNGPTTDPSAGMSIYSVTGNTDPPYAQDTCSSPSGAYVMLGDEPTGGLLEGTAAAPGGPVAEVQMTSPAGTTLDGYSATFDVGQVSGPAAWLTTWGGPGESIQLSGLGLSDSAFNTGALSDGSLPANTTTVGVRVSCAAGAGQSCSFDQAQSPGLLALYDLNFTVEDDTPPGVSATSGDLASAAETGATVSGVQRLDFTAQDGGAGVASAKVSLIPRASGQVGATQAATGSPYSCPSTSWHACATRETDSAAIDTSKLVDGSYDVQLTVTDGAGNSYTDHLGSIVASNDPVPVAGLAGSPAVSGSATVGSTLTGTPARFVDERDLAVSSQWVHCPQGVVSLPNPSCSTLPAAGATYAVTSADEGYEVAYETVATNVVGNATVVYSAPTQSVPLPATLPSGCRSDQCPPGTTLTAVDPTLPPGYHVTGYQWGYCDGAGFTPIAGATSKTYTVTPADSGHDLCYRVTASNGTTTITYTSTGVPVADGGNQDAPSPAQGGSASGQNGAPAGENGAPGANGLNGIDGGVPQITINIPQEGVKAAGPLGTAAAWRLNLSVNPHRVHRHSLITLSGRVSTAPRPAGGKLVVLQARTVTHRTERMAVCRARKRRARCTSHRTVRRRVTVYSSWVTFKTLRADAAGAYITHYRFRLAGDHRYQFQAVAPAEGGYANHSGGSNVVTVIESRGRARGARHARRHR